MPRPLILFTATLLPALAAGSDASRLDAQREAFRERHAEAELGTWNLSAADERLLDDYILWPDLQSTWLRSRLGKGNDAEVEAFLARHGDLKPARELRYRYALSLARRGLAEPFRELYRARYAALGVERLDCLALSLDLDEGLPETLPALARSLWLVGHSQVRECDAVFDRLRRAGLIDEALLRQRFELAIAERELGMARYLARSLGDEEKQEAARWTAAYGEPARFIARHAPDRRGARDLERLVAAVEQIAYDDAADARTAWQDIADEYPFTDDARGAVERHVALWLARQHRPQARAALAALPPGAVDDEVRRWRVRTALRAQAWEAVLKHGGELSAADRDAPAWRYWRAVALREAGRPGAEALFAELAKERSYYGFLAADALGARYDYSHSALSAEETVIARLARDTAFLRARELYMVGQDGRGRSEWDAAVRALPLGEQVQAAVLAHRWGWHSRAIATAARVDHYDDLAIRYPVAYAEEFERYAQAASVRTSLALGVARSESLFMPDIRSAAGAIGVMQLTPSTGRLTARELKTPYRGQVTLTDPASNIRLGTWFLGRMQARFDDNPVLATAAYNAGPRRVEAWLPERRPLDARIWIETIPYEETRDYVRRVLTADTIFDWRLGRQDSRLSQRLPDVAPAPTRVAAN